MNIENFSIPAGSSNAFVLQRVEMMIGIFGPTSEC